MSTQRPRLRSERWRNLDSGADPDSCVAYLDSGATELEELRREVIRSLQVDAGSRVLDVGSGAGEFLIEVATGVAGVEAVGVDSSHVMIATAVGRAKAAGVEVKFVHGDARNLEFPDGSFDRVNCSRVLVHMEDPAAVVAEMARVLAPGGRMAIVEPDHDALIIDSDDLDIARAVRLHLTQPLQNPDIGRRRRRYLIESGLEILDLSGRLFSRCRAFSVPSN
jgi:ubiquinone/menaquinone biosynthesis C-methylase UbiE